MLTEESPARSALWAVEVRFFGAAQALDRGKWNRLLAWYKTPRSQEADSGPDSSPCRPWDSRAWTQLSRKIPN